MAVGVSSVADSVVALSVVVGELLEGSWAGLDDAGVVELARRVETARRRLEAFDARLVAELDERNVAGQRVVSSTARLLGGVLNVSAREAHRRVAQARVLGPRLTVSGQRLAPVRPVLAAARAEGAVSGEHVQVILCALDKIPATVAVGQVEQAEAFLVERARVHAPGEVAGLGRVLVETLHPEAVLVEEAQAARRRWLSLRPAGDGMVGIRGELDARTGALAMTVLQALAAPKPTTQLPGGATVRDERSAGQRLHDGLRVGLKKLLSAGALPMSGGLPATVLISMSAEQYERGTGYALTSFGQWVGVAEALRLAGEGLIGWVVQHGSGAVLAYGQSRRIASAQQTRALIARDRGCVFPGCTDPPEWTERHHIVAWRDGGATDVDNLCLLCDFHHDRIDTEGWAITMHDGVPWFTPPDWIDPSQTPQRNERP
jgi:hypothetical protein